MSPTQIAPAAATASPTMGGSSPQNQTFVDGFLNRLEAAENAMYGNANRQQ
jgi:hypothetical protein